MIDRYQSLTVEIARISRYIKKIKTKEIADIDTIYVRAGAYGAISSSMVFELLSRNKDVSKYLPKYVIDVVK